MIVEPIRTTPKVLREAIPIPEIGPTFEGFEQELAAWSPGTFAALRTAADIVPFATFLFPSGRKEFAAGSLGQKVVHLGLDAAVFLPFGWIGKGLKVTAKPLFKPLAVAGRRLPSFGMRSINLEPKSVLDGLMRKLETFEYVTPRTGLAKTYGLSGDEVEAVLRGKSHVWAPVGRSGSWIYSPIHNAEKIFNKMGDLRRPAQKLMERWTTSREVQKLEFFKRQFKKYFKTLIGSDRVYKVDDLFKVQVGRLFGAKEVERLTWDTIGARDFSKVLLDTLLNEGKVLRKLDITNRAYILPIRKVFGPWEGMYHTMSRVYKPIKKAFGNANSASYMAVKQFHLIQANRGLGKITKRGEFRAGYSQAEWDEAGKLVRWMDDAQGSGAPQVAIQARFSQTSPTIQGIAKSYAVWTDYMYANFMKEKIPQLFHLRGLTPEGVNGLERLTSRFSGKMDSYITEVLAEGNNLGFENKVRVIENILGRFRTLAKDHPHWFLDFEAKEAIGAEKTLLKALTFRGKGAKVGFPHYLENYGQRLFDRPGRMTKLPPSKATAGFVKTRTKETAEEAVSDLGRVVERRATSQSKEVFVNPHLPEWNEAIATLPPKLKSYSNHYVKRMLGQASEVDAKVARMVNRLLGTHWDDSRVMRLAWTVNDLIYMGGIGFKPFSAMRNYIQPFLMVPADMGGIKDFYWLARGYRRAFQPETRKYIRDIGAITEYSPDLLFRPAVSQFGKILRVGEKEFSLPQMQKMRDYAMWMFKGSDRHNRYVTGGAALDKWEYFFNKYIRIGEGGKLETGTRGIERFKKKLNLGSRERWVQAEIEEQLRIGTRQSWEEAKALWVKDVIADTQYLYGAADSPLFAQVGGGVTRTAMVFQTWWMNYGSALGKWMFRSGDVSTSANRMLAWTLSSAVGYHIMAKPLWGPGTARRTVWTGPLPLDFDLPASWKPFHDAVKTLVVAGGIPLRVSDMEMAKKQMMATIRSSLIYAPGGLQIGQMVRGIRKEGFPGLAKSIIKYHGGE